MLGREQLYRDDMNSLLSVLVQNSDNVEIMITGIKNKLLFSFTKCYRDNLAKFCFQVDGSKTQR